MNEQRINRAQFFLKDCIKNGLAHSLDTKTGKYVKPYPEVTGYLLSLFVNNDFDLDMQRLMAKKLIKLQTNSGGWMSFFGSNIFVFDTAQIGKGLLDYYLLTRDESLLEPIKNAIKFILAMQINNGSFFPIFSEKDNEKIALGENWGNSFSVINCKTVEFLALAQSVNIFETSEAINNICQWTIKQEVLSYTHPSAYALEGLLAGGHSATVKNILNEYFLNRINNNGFISYSPDLDYSYVSGSVQIGILCYKVGYIEYAKKIYDWACLVQDNHYSGGLFQYANYDGKINDSIHAEINSWGTKYFIELAQLLINN